MCFWVVFSGFVSEEIIKIDFFFCGCVWLLGNFEGSEKKREIVIFFGCDFYVGVLCFKYVNCVACRLL